MLHAVNRKKARLEMFRGAGQRVPLEDIVTSSVFGTLSLLRAEDQHQALSFLFRQMGAPLPVWAGMPHILLWPKRPLSARSLRKNYVEPDVEIADGSGISLLIEVKWGAPLSPDELSAQWLSLAPASRASSRHLLLVLEPPAYRDAVAQERATVTAHTSDSWPLHVCSWRDLAQGCRLLSADPSIEQSIRNWAQQVHIFLVREDPRSLRGWDNIGLVAIDLSDWDFANGWFTALDEIGDLTWKVHTDE